MFLETDKLFVSVVGSLTDGSDDVVRRSLAVLAEVCSCQPHPHAHQGDTAQSDCTNKTSSYQTSGNSSHTPCY